MGEPHWLDDGEARAWRGHVLVSQLLHAQLERELMADSGLSHPDYAVLVTLSELEPGDDGIRRMRMIELARSISWSKSRLSHQVGRMEKRGLVERRICGEDARGAFVCLTEAGHEAIRNAAPHHVESVRRHLFDHLDRAQVLALADAYDTIAAHLLGTVVCGDGDDAACDGEVDEPTT